MPRLTLLVRGERHHLAYAPGPSVRDILDATDYRVRSACLGLGACGLCRVRRIAGDDGEVTAAERLQLGDAIATGLRLACQWRPTDDATVELLGLAPASEWRSPPNGLVLVDALARCPDRRAPPGIARPLGAAVDLGTSHLTIAVFDLLGGQPLTLRFGRNPQGAYGADVVTRLMAAQMPQTARQLASAARQAIGAALADAAAREGLDIGRIGRVVTVGNTAMLSLLANRAQDRLLQPANWTAPIDCAPTDAREWPRQWRIAPTAEVEVVPPLGGFVGSDLLAGLVASALTEGAAPALLVDFGTNSEIALWTGDRLLVTAAAGGPAFEVGAGRCGMPAEAGAVFRVAFADDGQPRCSILGDDRPRGICGSGLVDLVAGLRRLGVLTAIGRFADGGDAYALDVAGRSLSLTWRDVDALQRAKGAIGAGVALLCAEAGIGVGDLRRVVAAGLFGRHLDVANARSIGLLPPVPAERIELAGNTALVGAGALLLSEQAWSALDRARRAAALINLARVAAFDETFLEHLHLRPMPT